MFVALKSYDVKVGILTGVIGGTLMLGSYVISAYSATKEGIDSYIQEQAKETFEEIKIAASKEAKKDIKHFNRRLNGVQEQVNVQTSNSRRTRQKVDKLDGQLIGIQGQLNTIIKLMDK